MHEERVTSEILTPPGSDPATTRMGGITDVQGAESSLLSDQPILTLETQLRGLERAQSEAFRLERERAGGAVKWFRSRCPRSASSFAATETELESALPLETRSFWVGVETRLEECGGCQPRKIACAQTNDRLGAGVVVKLRLGQDGVPAEEVKPCLRYQDYRLAQRLEQIGVAPRLSGIGMPPTPRSEVLGAFEKFMETGEAGRAPRGQLLIQGPQARGWGVLLLRTCVLAHPHASYQSTHVPSLVREAKSSFTRKEEYPLMPLAQVDVLVIDGVTDELLATKQWLKEVLWLVELRRDQERGTIITATTDAKEAFRIKDVLRV